MQIFITGSPFETAQALDKRRLNKQIIECRQILKAINGESKAWANHPCVKMYRNHEMWLCHCLMALGLYKEGDEEKARRWSGYADRSRPKFHTQEYFNQMKRRLYTKDHEHYKQWSVYGESDINWYYVDGEWMLYRNGKRLSSSLGK